MKFAKLPTATEGHSSDSLSSRVLLLQTGSWVRVASAFKSRCRTGRGTSASNSLYR